VKWKLEIEMKLLGKNGIRVGIEFFFQNGNDTVATVLLVKELGQSCQLPW